MSDGEIQRLRCKNENLTKGSIRRALPSNSHLCCRSSNQSGFPAIPTKFIWKSVMVPLCFLRRPVGGGRQTILPAPQRPARRSPLDIWMGKHLGTVSKESSRCRCIVPPCVLFFYVIITWNITIHPKRMNLLTRLNLQKVPRNLISVFN